MTDNPGNPRVDANAIRTSETGSKSREARRAEKEKKQKAPERQGQGNVSDIRRSETGSEDSHVPAKEDTNAPSSSHEQPNKARRKGGSK
ncbi:MAG TPA: hypothetical protein VFB38_21045 [Chthonomonadaceae bacterium]|nr:hypothetical protein [Chthonomonadaceae bacterium]